MPLSTHQIVVGVSLFADQIKVEVCIEHHTRDVRSRPCAVAFTQEVFGLAILRRTGRRSCPWKSVGDWLVRL